MALLKFSIPMQKNEGRPCLSPIIKFISKWFKDLNVRPTTVKLSEENKGEMLHDIGMDNDFFFR
jgi:hypothetical protein